MPAKAKTILIIWNAILVCFCWYCGAKPVQPSTKDGSVLDVLDIVNGQLRDVQIIVGKYLAEYRNSFPKDNDNEFEVTCCQKITIISHDALSSPCLRLKKLVKNLLEFSRPNGKFQQFIMQGKVQNNTKLLLKIQYLLDKTKILYENFLYLFSFDRRSNVNKIFRKLETTQPSLSSNSNNQPKDINITTAPSIENDQNFMDEWYYNLVDYDSNLNAIFITLLLLRESVVTEGRLDCRR
ncbi:uncharacterized protein TRIADDRAFT_58653 [Trichoplax adhaerens]|uniref:Interleukin-6 n=1 Tax=Trichoplax adhaerens TaxID=10228 RepID=B3S3A8_TRIAD|nr:predicted protein [Trichoplax adhaerens]EDV22757.1 predicted protein [Trichoplax adhaerens]|eukprot:XP_002114623.1 predicted protein [Trichoplax adhaerens]